MKKFLVIALAALMLVAFFGCAKKEAAPVAAAPAPVATVAPAAPVAPPAPTSDGSKDLTVEFQYNTAAADANNHFTFTGNIRYMAAEDKLDETTGASLAGTTHLLNAYLYDVEGKTTFFSGLRSFFLFATNPYSQAEGDDVTVSKAADGVITMMYAHRGTAYMMQTNAQGKLTFPEGNFKQRTIGYIKGAGPQVISKDFSADGTAPGIDWAKVWDSSVAGGKLVDDVNATAKTGNIVKAGADPASMFYFAGSLDVTLESNILKIAGSLTAVPRR